MWFVATKTGGFFRYKPVLQGGRYFPRLTPLKQVKQVRPTRIEKWHDLEKPEDDKRELTIRLRATASEKSRIWQNAKDAGLTPSDFLRGLAINARPARAVPTPDREVLLKLLAELNMQGSNLNQVARALNRRQDSGEVIRHRRTACQPYPARDR